MTREMKYFTLIFASFLACASSVMSARAITVKKAAPVATKETSATDTTASLVPTVLGLVGGIQQLNAQQKALTAECIPSSQEITFVDNTMKEWAKTGAMSAGDVQTALRRRPCNVASGGYAASVQIAAGTETNDICYDWFAGDGNEGMVWYRFPKVGRTTYCADGSLTCGEKDKKNASDIYELFNLIDFSEADYTKQEATMAARLITKIEKCSPAKLSAKKKAMWGEFLVDTIGNVGQSTNTGAIMQQVGALQQSGGGGIGALGSLGSVVGQFMDR